MKSKSVSSGIMSCVWLCALVPFLAAAAAPESEQKTRVRFSYLCTHSNILPIPFESERCRNAEAVRAADVASLRAEMETYWSVYPAPTRRHYFDEEFAAYYAKKYPPAPPTAEAFQKMDNGAVCKWWRTRKPPAALAELKRRAAFNANDLNLISGKQIALGMTEGALLCSWGPANDRNRTVNQAGTSIQYIYGDKLVYVENGVVTAWQD